MVTTKQINLPSDIWICDSGACGHYCRFMEGLMNVRDINEEITIGNGHTMVATKLGDLKCEVTQVNGLKFDVVLKEVKYVPELWVNLFSINKALKNGFKLSNDGISICLSKGPIWLSFDQIIPTTNGFVTGVKMCAVRRDIAYNALVNTTINNKGFDVNHLHKVFGHCGIEAVKNTAKIHNLQLFGKFEVCKDCAIAKAKQKGVNKVWSGGSNIPGERVYVDISSIKERSFGGAKFWALVVDDYSDFCWSFFLKNKSDLKVKMINLLTDLKIADVNVKFIRCDDAGENKSMKDDHRIKSFGVKFEFSGPRTPQRNGKVERKFQTFYGRIRSMLNGAGLKDELRTKIWAECAMTTTYLSNIIATKSESKCPYELLFGCKPRLNSNLKAFGEIGVVTTKDKIQGKLKNRGTPCMFVGYTENHSRDVYRMLNLETHGIINSRDIVWLNKMHKDWIKDKSTITKTDDDDYDDLPIIKHVL